MVNIVKRSATIFWVMATLASISHAQSAATFAAPTPNWWDSREFFVQNPGDELITESASHGRAFGGPITIPNVARPDYTKYVFFDILWRPVNTGDPVTIDKPIIQWPDQNGIVQFGAMTLGGTLLPNNDGFFESWFSYTITPQPASEVIKPQWIIGQPNIDIRFKYQAGSYCVPVPEPATYGLALIGLVVIAFVTSIRGASSTDNA